MKRFLKGSLPIILIILLSFLVWHKILNQIFLGEGYMYFNTNLIFVDWKGVYNIWGYDNVARLIFSIFPPIFRDNLLAYQFLELIIAISLYISIYFVVYKITKDKLIALTSAIFFLGNYVGSYFLMATGNYQRFVQRVPNLIPAIFAFLFLFYFYKEKKIKYYLFSLGFYSLSLFAGHFSSLILPLFVIYPLVQLFEEKLTVKETILRLSEIALFIAITFLITKRSEEAPARNFIQFLQSEPHLLERVIYQIPMITIPLNLIISVANTFKPPIKDPYTPILKIFSYLCVSINLFGAFVIIKKVPRLFTLYITCFLSMLGTMLLYIYIDPRLNVLIYFGADRYFIISSIFAAISWALIIKAVFQNKKMYYIFSAVILVVYISYNISAINTSINSIQYKSEEMKKVIYYGEKIAPKFTNSSVIIAPYYIAWCLPVVTRFHSPDGASLVLPTNGWEEKYWSQRENVFVLDYDYERIPGEGFNAERGHVVDLTQKYRNGEKIQFLN